MRRLPVAESAMGDSEFDIIRRYFMRQSVKREDVVTGVGDDAAVLTVPPGQELVVCMDTLVAGVHFPDNTAAAAIGHKSLAVNLSDLAAMGATPAWATLSLTLPENNPGWLNDFSRAFFTLADRYRVQLVGGDTTCGPLSVTVQAHGFVSEGAALKRTGAKPGDRIFVTGTLGDAGLALQLGENAADSLQQKLDYPEPRIEAGQVLAGHASAAIDISDGLLADLGHLLEADRLGAAIQVDALPRSADFIAALEKHGSDQPSWFNDLPLGAGDDYELCFTVAEKSCATLEAQFSGLSCGCTQIGIIEESAGIRCLLADGTRYQPAAEGYLHFDGAEK
jgi:thiamine-monophosphate kinase